MSSYNDLKSTFEYGASLLDAKSDDARKLNDCFNFAIGEVESLENSEQDQAFDRLDEIKQDLHTIKICNLDTLIARLQASGFSGTIPKRYNK